MNTWQLILRSLLHYRRTGIAVVVGVAIASAVIIGSLVTGDSVRGSIKDTALGRLGKIDYALISPHFFRDQLAADIFHKVKAHRIVPAVIMRGSASNAMTDAAAPNAGVIGVDADFWGLWGLKVAISGRQAGISRALARDLGLKPGDSILVNVDRQGTARGGTLFEKRSREDTVSSMRLDVAVILPDNGVGGFKLDSGTDASRNVFVSREWLLKEIDKPGKANAMLVESAVKTDILAELAEALKYNSRLADLGIKCVPNPANGYFSVESDAAVFADTQTKAANSASVEIDANRALTSVYLATTIKKQGTQGGIPYSIVAGAEPLDKFRFTGQVPKSSAPNSNSIWLNTWAADDIGAKTGDKIELDYLVSNPDGTYKEKSMALTLGGVVQMTGPAADQGLVPTFGGITDAKRIDEWKTPFPVDMNRIRAKDEDYWNRFRTTPKAFVSMETAREMWASGAPASSSIGWVTSVRVRPRVKYDMNSSAQAFEYAMNWELWRNDTPMAFRPVKKIALTASEGTTDFSQLFLGMSMFLVIAGAGLAGTLMRLSVQRRASEAGIMMACGFNNGQVRRVLFGEGMCLAVLGTLAGVPIGILYAWGVIAALRSWWIGAVGTSALWLHVDIGSVLIGLVSGLVVGAISVNAGGSGLSRSKVLELLAGWQALAVAAKPVTNSRAIIVLIASLAISVALLVMASIQIFTAQGAFFGCGALLLVAGLAGADLSLARVLSGKPGKVSARMLALRSAAANRGRGLLVIGLISTASFMIVAVAANTKNFSRIDYTQKSSGTGGFALRAVSSIPIRYDFGTLAGRKALDFDPGDESAFAGVKVYSCLMSPGDDISCLNLAKTSQPRLIGLPDEFIRRGGFSVTTEKPTADPWKMLQGYDLFVFGDADSVMWSLHSSLGHKLIVKNQNGGEMLTWISGLVQGSIFAGELLTSKKTFKMIFPDVTAPRYYLIETTAGKADAVAEALRRNLGDMGLEVRCTREILNSYMSVQNTYLSVFLALGGLGLLLGTFGLVAVIMRSALERRREFALMLAVGLTDREIAKMLILENAGLLLVGLVFGTITALVAVAPHALSSESQIGWGAIVAALALIAGVGYSACAIAAKNVVNGALMQALREE